ncbi:uncharacterized protein PAC_11215 [Phialocephala subalpina]|uniref:C2H2-type domain-containing protein n=1 Tax=Phialocephala subalpina TaxID=576137 RepID=A0A1L7X8G5_9HELO|nr:uncharacterized protein PAC_11215 [Phialocephala subalpina]
MPPQMKVTLSSSPTTNARVGRPCSGINTQVEVNAFPWIDASQDDVVFDSSNPTTSWGVDIGGSPVTRPLINPYLDGIVYSSDKSVANAVSNSQNNPWFTNVLGIHDNSMSKENHTKNTNLTCFWPARVGIPVIPTENIIDDLEVSAGFGQGFMLHGIPRAAWGYGDALTCAITVPAPTQLPVPAQPTALHHSCKWPSCNIAFKRRSDLTRHRDTVHFPLQGHFCAIAGCTKASGAGYNRADKVTEHLWKKHGDLGYTKA